MSEWISVKDKMPEPLEDVLVCHWDEITGGPEIDIEWADHEGSFVFEGCKGPVSHWMPLPAIPEDR